jgi:hypothetical protein
MRTSARRVLLNTEEWKARKEKKNGRIMVCKIGKQYVLHWG